MNLFRWRQRQDEELDAEIRQHLEMAERERIERGESAEQARLNARREFGNVGLVKEVTRETWGWVGLERLMQDLRFGLRMLRKNPGFSLVAILTLGLGIGANTAIFSVVNGVLLKPLPYQEPDRLAMLWKVNAKQNLYEDGTSIPSFLDWRAQSRTFADLAVFAGVNKVFLTSGDEPEQAYTVRASANLFELLGIKPVLGRTFSVEEEERRERVVVLSYGLWQRRFGGSADVVGKVLELNGQSSQVIGVIPEGFYFPTKEVQLWEPTTLFERFDQVRATRGNDDWNVVGRLNSGVTLQTAQTEMNLIDQRLGLSHPTSDPSRAGINVVPLPVQTAGKNLRLALWVLLGAVAFVLLIACANVANLLLARGAARGREFAIRAALGAGRGRLLRQMLTESMLLAAGASLLGLGLAAAGMRALIALAPPGIPRLDEIRIDTNVLLFTVGLSLLTGLLFGLAPAWKVSQQRPHQTLKGSVSRLRLKQASGLLIAAECALAVTLLAGAGLLLRSFQRLQAVDSGFKPEGALLLRIARTGTSPNPVGFPQIRERIAALPGVVAVGMIGHPYGGVLRTATPENKTLFVADQTKPISFPIDNASVSPGFFEAMGATLLKGRFFSEADVPRTLPREFTADGVVINETLARRLFSNEDPIGKRIGDGRHWHTIVGVVKDMRHQGLEQQPVAEIFRLREVNGDWVVRTSSDPLTLASAIREAVRSVDRQTTVTSLKTLSSQTATLSAERRFQTWLLTLFALTALALSGIGIFGVMQFAVAQRTHEIGIRLALGASRSDIMRAVISPGLKLAATGVIIGLLAALWLTRLIAHLLFTVRAADPATLIGVALLLAGVAFLACYLPARKATHIDPLIALRHE